MTPNEILTGVLAIGSAVIGYSAKYIGGLLNKKKDETIRNFEVDLLKERYKELRKEIDDIKEKADEIPVIKQQIKQLEREQDNKH